jgi:hypothetical protein
MIVGSLRCQLVCDSSDELVIKPIVQFMTLPEFFQVIYKAREGRLRYLPAIGLKFFLGNR